LLVSAVLVTNARLLTLVGQDSGAKKSIIYKCKKIITDLQNWYPAQIYIKHNNFWAFCDFWQLHFNVKNFRFFKKFYDTNPTDLGSIDKCSV